MHRKENEKETLLELMSLKELATHTKRYKQPSSIFFLQSSMSKAR